MEDQDLIYRVLNGNVDAFRLLYARHKTAAWNVAMYICKNETLAKDAVQVSFTNAYQYLRSFHKSSSFKTWLLRIVKNECYRIMKLESKYYGDGDIDVND
ncbi:MAG: RNA polymerase sigma factor, partial [Bacteroidia bacterium]